MLEAAGQPAPRIERPAGLTDREAQVVGLLARGLQTKQVAHALGISVKTADTHVQNAYRKIGVSTRAAATLFAMQHGLVASGELPIAGAPAGHSVRSEQAHDAEGADMAAKIESATTIARPVEDVFQFLLDLDQHPSDPGVESVVRSPNGPTGPGTTLRFTHAKGRETTMRFTAVEPEPAGSGSRARSGRSGPPATSTSRTANGQTTLTVRVAPNPAGPLKLLSPLVNRVGQRVWDRRLARIKAALEAPAP